MFLFFRTNHFIYLCILLLVSSCSNSEQKKQQYYTWDGLEPDRWSSLWLLKRYIDPNAEIVVLPAGAQLNNARAVATPNSPIKRTHGFSNYENMLKSSESANNIGLVRMGKIINEIEISPWKSSTPAVSVIENQFRSLQFKYNRVDVPYECYSGFFDVLYRLLNDADVSDSQTYLDSLNIQLSPDNVCQISADSIATKYDAPVLEYSVEHVLKMINANKMVVFVDTREDDEFDERHIPGAINLKLREVDAASAKQFEQADLVISYCIKDFRGYEVALALHKVGVTKVGIMKPYGLKGWKDLNLPVASEAIPENVALDALKKRAASGV